MVAAAAAAAAAGVAIAIPIAIAKTRVLLSAYLELLEKIFAQSLLPKPVVFRLKINDGNQSKQLLSDS